MVDLCDLMRRCRSVSTSLILYNSATTSNYHLLLQFSKKTFTSFILNSPHARRPSLCPRRWGNEGTLHKSVAGKKSTRFENVYLWKMNSSGRAVRLLMLWFFFCTFILRISILAKNKAQVFILNQFIRLTLSYMYMRDIYYEAWPPLDAMHAAHLSAQGL